MRRTGYICLFILALTMGHNQAFAQKEKYHSIFLYNFSKYIKWPDDQTSGEFVIGVLGSSSIVDDIKSMAATKKVNGNPIKVVQYKSMEGIQDCQILYVCASESNKIDQIVSGTESAPVLIVTDRQGLAQNGSIINFVEVDGKIKFELNERNAELRNLKVSSSLITLAIVV